MSEKTYTVVWTIPIEASSPRAAAAKALVIQRDINSIATVFDVFEGDALTIPKNKLDRSTTIDLG